MIVAGVDGCRRGWVVALAEGTDVDIRVVERFDAVMALLNDGVTSIAVDMPIGLPACGRRACDVRARRALGPRRSSVFPAPPRPLLGERDYSTALRMKRELDGVGLSKQAFFLLPKIAEVDAAVTPARQMVVVEAHPELAFARLAGEPLNSSKRTPEGRSEREALLASTMAAVPAGSVPGTARHDLLDALALTITARRLAKGTAERLGDGTRDERGLVMEIAW